MRAINLEDILKNLGWVDGFQIPVANADNQCLEAEVAKLTLIKLKAKYAYEDALAKFDGLHSHLKHLQQESDLNQKLINAHRQQYEVEESTYRRAKIQRDSTESEVKKTAKMLEDLQKSTANRKVEIQIGNARLEKLKTEIQWDTEALKAWEESLKRRYVDNETIEKFSKEDERRYNELEAKRQALQMEHVTRTATIKKMVGDIKEYENIVDKAGKTMKMQVAERDALIEHWKEAVKTLHQRDRNIELYERQISDALEVLHKQKEQLEEQNNFLENEKRNNAQIMMEIEEANIQNSRMRKESNELANYIAQITSELDTSKRLMTSTAKSLERQRINLRSMIQDMKNKKRRLVEYDKLIDELEGKLEELSESNFTSQEKLKYLERLMLYEERRYQSLVADHEKMQTVLYRSRQQLFEQQNKRKMQDVQINSTRTAISKLTKFNRETEGELQKKKEVLYDMNLRIDKLEDKMSKMEKLVVDDETIDLKNKIATLEGILKDHEEVRNLLQDQMNRIERDMAKLSLLIAQDQVQVNNLRDKLQNERMLFEGGQKIVAAAMLRSQEKQVEENVIRLRVSQFDKAMKKEEDNIYTLKKFRLTLDQLMRERYLEISTNKDILLAKKRNADEDRGRLKGDIMSRNIRIDQFKKKYHGALMLLGTDEEGQPLTLTYHKIKASQEKFLLQQEGDELDAKIKKAEKEIIAMENTLKVVNLTNSKFKHSLGIVDSKGDEVKELKSLEKKLREMATCIQKNKNTFEDKENELREIEKKLAQIGLEREGLQKEYDEHVCSLKYKYNKDKEAGEKLQRTECNIRKVLKQLGNFALEKYERDFEIRQLKDANKAVTARMTQLQNIYQEMAPLIKRYMSEYSMTLPDKSYVSSDSSNLSRNSRCSDSTSTSSRNSVRSTTRESSVKVFTVALQFQVPPKK